MIPSKIGTEISRARSRPEDAFFSLISKLQQDHGLTNFILAGGLRITMLVRRTGE